MGRRETISIGVLDLVLDLGENRVAIQLGVGTVHEVGVRDFVRGRSVLEVVGVRTMLVCGSTFLVAAIRRHLREMTGLHRRVRLVDALDNSAVCAVLGPAIQLQEIPGVDLGMAQNRQSNGQKASRETVVGYEELEVAKRKFYGGLMKDGPRECPGVRHCKGLRLPPDGQQNMKNHRLHETHLTDTVDSSLPCDLRLDAGTVCAVVAAACGHERCRSVGELYGTRRVPFRPIGIIVPGEAAGIAFL